MIQHLEQNKKNNCGQTCVAMITGKSIEEVELAMGVSGQTRTYHLCKALYHLGFRTFNKLDRGFDLSDRPAPYYILKCKITRRDNGKSWYHWVVWDNKDNRVLDPGLQEAQPSFGTWAYLVNRDNLIVKITSSLKVYHLPA